MSEPLPLRSDQHLADVEHPFRVFAGPGAGKTRWLIGHIHDVIARSRRLNNVSKIACISYTNVAVDEITRRLGGANVHVEVSTIHGFLYRNVLKPYVHLIRDGEGQPVFDYAEVDGHDDHHVNFQHVDRWLRDLKQYKYLKKEEREKVNAVLQRIEWMWTGTDDAWVLMSRHWAFKTLPRKIQQGLYDYKRQYWREGRLDHDDVLRFAHLLLTEYPVLKRHLAARFPYLFIDEFQDTHPVQAELVRWLAEAGATVGVIGDAEQAIYGFQGADPKRFLEFEIPGVADYVIQGNWRSTNQIIALLNRVRSDGIIQHGLKDKNGEPVELLVGTPRDAVVHARALMGTGAVVHVLAWTNELIRTVRALDRTRGASVWDEFMNADARRARLFEGLATAVVLARQKRPGEAIQAILKAIRVRSKQVREPFKYDGSFSDLQKRSAAVSLLVQLLRLDGEGSDMSVAEVYQELADFLPEACRGLSLIKLTSGKPKTFATETSFGELLRTVDLKDTPNEIRTIHGAKGTEFSTVLLCLHEPRWIVHLGCDGEGGDAEHRRLVYVGLSRAQDRLFVSVDTLTPEAEASARAAGLVVRRL